MLVLTRRETEAVLIADQIRITVLEIQGNKVRIGIDAPRDVQIVREEIRDKYPEEEK